MRGLVKKGIDTYLNYKSFKTKTPVMIIESDDWGSLRTKNKTVREKLNAIEPKAKLDQFTQLDSIATEDDLEDLFEVLMSVKDRNGNPACFTPNVCTANPDFEAIKDSNFESFYYQPFTKALDDYSKTKSLLEIWKNGKEEGIFKPQLHGREHVHALAWLAELRAGNKKLLKAFECETWGIPYKALTFQLRKNFQASLDCYGIEDEDQYQKQWIEESADIFKDALGYRPSSFIAPAYVWHSKIHKQLSSIGINSVQGLKLQYQPEHTNKVKYTKKPHYTGKVDKTSGITYTTRNTFFEPHSAPHKDWGDIILSRIKNNLKQKKPIILSTHRINFVGRLDLKHRDQNLKTFKHVLKQIVKQYPDIQFMDSGTLAKLLSKEDRKES